MGDAAMDEEYEHPNPLHAKSGIMLGMIAGSGWAMLAVIQPVIWAWVTAVVLAMLFGLFTAKFLFDVHNLWKALALAPFLGCCWIGLFYIVIRIVNG
jgi:hypothetical protein